MEESRTPRLLPRCTLPEAETLIANARPLLGETEEFPDNRRFCIRPLEGEEVLEEVYRTNQDTFNDLSGELCLILTEVLATCGGDPDKLIAAFNAIAALYAHNPRGAPDNDEEWIQNKLDGELDEDTTDGHAASIFFYFLAFYRQVMAAMAGDEDWRDFGASRYMNQTAIQTPLSTPRYLPSFERCQWTQLYATHRAYLELDDPETETIDGTELPTKITIVKRFGDDLIYCGSIDRSGLLINVCIDSDQYELVNEEIARLFTLLVNPMLLDPRAYLETVFTIQYWFIHLMPYHRGSAAIMNQFRYAMTASYNHRIRGSGLTPLPMVPAKTGYFPDLDALLTCMTPEEFVTRSMEEIYCVNFTAYCQ